MQCRATAENNYNSLVACHYKQHLSYYIELLDSVFIVKLIKTAFKGNGKTDAAEAVK